MAHTPDKRAGAGLPDDSAAVDAFLARLDATAPRAQRGPGRLMFVLDATMSRQPTWDRACHLQADMFDAAAEVGGIEVKLVFFRGRRECRASGWMADPAALGVKMAGVRCQGGLTQIGRALRHALAQEPHPDALVYVGDACEEPADPLCHQASELGARGTPVFLFHEGGHPVPARVFKEMARLSGGAYLPFSEASADQLRELLRAVAVFTGGGRRALESAGDAGARRLLAALPPS
ncbi:MAG: VWA domain-containing protein [Rhodothalassiaceae bacterium]